MSEQDSVSDPLTTGRGQNPDGVFGPGSPQDDGVPVGEADRLADDAGSGTDGDRDGLGGSGARDPHELLTGGDEPVMTDDGEAVGAADRDADVERTR